MKNKKPKHMKVIIDGKIYDSQKVPVVLVWDTDQERKETLLQIGSMEPRDQHRMYLSCPVGTNMHQELDDAQMLYEHSKEPAVSMTW